MQFVKNGPDIPDQLLQAHEEGRVVFFCGAGISYPAGLLGFDGLVDQVFASLHTHKEASEEHAFLNKQYDATLDLLERRFPGGRVAVRSAIALALKPKYRKAGATLTHEALLDLARCRNGSVRLVTTNFDRIFEHVVKKNKLKIPHYPAPQLPIPKNSRWNGVVYLHGLLPSKHDEGALQRLVVSSGDFGLAYLTERWASRFVSELFRNYVVCFVGYSIGDPVLRYMMDALAADRMLGEITPVAYALGQYLPGEKEKAKANWDSKGVTPILYETPDGRDHSALHGTLVEWSRTYRDGVQGRERIVVDYATAVPMVSTVQDDFIGRMLWALSHESGLPAKRFAEFDPVPSLDWLSAISENRYRQADLGRFGVAPLSQEDKNLSFSLARRPAPYTHAQWMSIAHPGVEASSWDVVMFQLARWLIRHLGDPALILWLVGQGGRMHDRLVWLIDSRLAELDKLQAAGNAAALQAITATAPHGIPSDLVRTLWRLLLSRRVKFSSHSLDLYRWGRNLQHKGLTATVRMELREILSPKVRLSEPYRVPDEDEDGVAEVTRMRDIVEWDIEFATDHIRSAVNDLQRLTGWGAAMPMLFDDFQRLLLDTLDLFREMGDASDTTDRSYWDISSISPHWQNRGFRDWTTLIELLRDSWLAIYEGDSGRARNLAHEWLSAPYPTFKRLAYFAASHPGIAPGGAWVEWLADDDGWWIWSHQTQREVLRLLVLRGSELTDVHKVRLETAILSGPPRGMYRDNLDENDWQRTKDRTIWLRLAKLRFGGVELGEDALLTLRRLSKLYPEWAVAANERDEFSHWMSGTGDPDFAGQQQLERAPRDKQDLMAWLVRPAVEGFFYQDDWRVICRERFRTAFRALRSLALAGQWPAERWSEALQVWNDKSMIRKSWHFVAPLLSFAPQEFLLLSAGSLTWWMESAAKETTEYGPQLVELSRRVLALELEPEVDEGQPGHRAINHPVGRVTQVLLDYWLRQSPKDGDGLPVELREIFTGLADNRVVRFRHGQVLLAAHAIPLFRVDPDWTTEAVLPNFSWTVSVPEARASWQGFLWSPRLYRPLLTELKHDLLDSANHYEELGDLQAQFASFLTYAGLDRADTFTAVELAVAVSRLPPDGLKECAQALSRALEGAGSERELYWANRVEPFWHDVWPKAVNRITPGISQELARVVVAAGGSFPRALAVLRNFIQPFEHPGFVLRKLHTAGLCARFPRDAFAFVSLIVANDVWPDELAVCLREIEQVWPEVTANLRYRELLDLVARRGG